MAPRTMILPGTVSRTTQVPLPTLLMENLVRGTVAMWEPGNTLLPLLPWDPTSRTVGVPADGSSVPNLARINGVAAATIGSDPGDFIIANNVAAGSVKTKVERTRAGCIHVMSSQVNQVASGYETFRGGMGAAALAYCNAHTADSWYLGAWFRKTRDFPGGISTVPIIGLMKGDPRNNVADRWITAGPNSTSTHITTAPVAGDARTIGVTTIDDGGAGLLMFVGVSASSAGGAFTALDRFINIGAATAGAINQIPSVIPIRGYLENLTASGRSHADRLAIDQAEFVAQCQTAGGRYYSDTLANGAFSNPVTALP